MKFLFFIISLLPLAVCSQIFGDNGVDLEVLEKEVFKQINRIRTSKRLDSLTGDVILKEAANDHTLYMVENNELGHFQKAKVKRTPANRVKYYSGTHNAIGENVQYINLDYELEKVKNRLTYERLAKVLVDQWKKSKPHYKNIINPSFSHAGLALERGKDGRLYATMVYGSEPFDEKYNYAKASTLDIKDKKECFSCNTVRKRLDKDKAYLGWYTVSNDSVYYWNVKKYNKRNNDHRIFGGKGKISIDLIHHEQFDCNGEASFHNSLYHDGYYLGYVDKRKLKNENVSPYAGMYKVFVSAKPAFLDTFYQVDFNYLRRDRPCLKNTLIFVNPDFLKPSEYFDLPKPTVELGKQLIVSDSISVKVLFGRNKTNEDSSIFTPLKKALDSLVSDNLSITRIRYSGVASIEGSRNINEALFSKRGALIALYLKRYYPQINFEKEFFENFDDFRSGLPPLGFNEFVDASEDSLRIFANENVKTSGIDSLLDETRYSTVSISFSRYIPLQAGSDALSIERLEELIEAERITELLPLYQYMSNLGLAGDTALTKKLLNLNFPDQRKYAELHWSKFVLDLKVNETEVTGERLNDLLQIGAIKTDEEFAEYALLFNVYYGYSAIQYRQFSALIKDVKGKRKRAWLHALHDVSEVQTFRLAPTLAVKKLYKSVLKNKLGSKETYFICQFMISWGYTTEPYLLLSKYAKRSGNIPKFYKQYLKLGYYLKQFDNPRNWKKIKKVIKNLATDYPDEFCSLFRWNEMGVSSLLKKEIAELFCEKCR